MPLAGAGIRDPKLGALPAGSSNWSAPYCSGLWPSVGGSSAYAGDCYGHDEPGIQFFSTLRGSGGNFTWNLTLPVGRSATQNQSSLYEAVWIGVALSDPYAWLGQCFLELQFYPDSTWAGSTTVPGKWIGAAVAWQIDLRLGVEDPCFYEPLYLNGQPGPAFLNMTEGDHLSVTMTGWPGNVSGEQVNVADLSSGLSSHLSVYNATASLPLNPAYYTNSYQNAVEWTPGGEYPVVLAFETGHARNPNYPTNNTYSGCGPGIPPPTPLNMSVPCPSYDPSSWANDTLHPWQIGVPFFFNATARTHPAQIAFTSTFGGASLLSQIGGSSCTGRTSTSWCSYPWYSFSCASHAFEFGATDYPGVTTDFGKSSEFSATRETNSAGLGFYPPANFTLPSCAAPNYRATVGAQGGAGGLVHFLSQSYTTPTAVPGLSPGVYAINAVPASGMVFQRWATSGSASVELPLSPWTALVVSGNGTAQAVFATLAAQVSVTFNDTPSGRVIIKAGSFFSSGAPLGTLSSGGTLSLYPGIYTILTYPSIGFNFSKWTVSNNGARVAAQYSPFTWLLVTGLQSSVAVTAHSAGSIQTDTVRISTFNLVTSKVGGGSVTLGGFLTTTTAVTSVPLAVGSYSLAANPAAGFVFLEWFYTWSSVMIDFRASTNVTLENGTYNASHSAGIIVAVFLPIPIPVTFVSAPLGGGQVLVAATGSLVSGGSVSLYPGGIYLVESVPASGRLFNSWAVNNSARAWNMLPGNWYDLILVNASVTVTVSFVSGSMHSVTFLDRPASAGSILFDLTNTYANGTTNASLVGGGYYLIRPLPAPGFSFQGWTTTGALTLGQNVLTGSYLLVSGSGNLTANFAPTRFPVTLVDSTGGGASFTLNGTTIASGSAVWLAAGTYALSVTVGAQATFLSWSTTRNLSTTSAVAPSSSVTVSGSGTIAALIAPFAIQSVTVSPAAVDVGVSTTFLVTVGPTQTYAYNWQSLPPGCTGTNVNPLPCSPSATGNYSVSVAVTDPWGLTLHSSSTTLTVNSLPKLDSIAASPAQIDVGVSVTFSASRSGGTEPFTFAYTGLPAGCASQNAATLTCSPTAQGVFVVNVTVTDAYSQVSENNTTLTVNALPTLQVILTPGSSFSAGKSLTIQAVVVGGTGPFTFDYSGLPAGCASANATAVTCLPTATGTFNVVVKVTDAFGKNATQQLVVSIVPPATSSSTSLGSYLLLGILLLLAIAAVAFFALRGRRRGPPAPEKPLTAWQSPAAAVPKPSAPPEEVPEWMEPPPPPGEEWREGP